MWGRYGRPRPSGEVFIWRAEPVVRWPPWPGADQQQHGGPDDRAEGVAEQVPGRADPIGEQGLV